MSSSKGSECVRVCVRCRPFSKQEIEDGRTCIVSVDPSRCEIQVRNPKQEEQPRMFTFDLVYPQDCLQEKIHQQAAHPIVQSVLEGYNGTIFAYGQTGTGKTYTMEGQQEPSDKRGIIPRAFEQIFYGVEQSPGKQFLVRASFLEIYNEEIRDLLSKNPKNRLELKENVETGFYVKDLSSFVVKNIEEMREIMLSGISHRSTGETNMNERSSRSHCIFTITVEQSEVWQDGRQHYRVGKLNLVDLAGSERQSKTGSTGERLVEATKINQSLSTLGNVISALVDGKSTHIPYRDSKLTKLLMDSLGGNTKTVMMANIGPADFNYEETLSTLRYASRAKSIKNKPKINEDPKDALLREYQDEIARLRAQLELQQQGAFQGGPGMPGQVIEVEKIVQIEDTEKIQQMEAKIEKEKQQIIQESQKQIQDVLNQKNLAEEEKQKLIRKLKKQESKQTKAKEKQQKDLNKLKQFEEQLIRGQQIMEQAVRQEQELAYMQQTIAQQRQQEQQIAKQLAHKKEQNLVKQQQFSSEEQQLEAINEKISTC